MADHGTAIEWTQAPGFKGETWNPTVGCDRVSPGCANCYAMALAPRLRAMQQARGGGVWADAPDGGPASGPAFGLQLVEDRVTQPLRWEKPRMVFVNSMSDLFHDQVPDAFIARVFAVMALAHRHTFQVLTKRPERMRDLLGSPRWNRLLADAILGVGTHDVEVFSDSPAVLPNVWLGVSIENRRFVGRADVLRATPAAVRFISAEPLLGPLTVPATGARFRAYGDRAPRDYREALSLRHIDWLIVGGESGPGARRFDADWARDLRFDASSPGDPKFRTAFFVKQIGGLKPGTRLEDLPEDLRIREWPEAVTHAAR